MRFNECELTRVHQPWSHHNLCESGVNLTFGLLDGNLATAGRGNTRYRYLLHIQNLLKQCTYDSHINTMTMAYVHQSMSRVSIYDGHSMIWKYTT